LPARSASGEIYVLESVEPIRIVDLAQRVAGSSRPNSAPHIDFEIIGIRPGERLHERLWEQDATLLSTRFAGIYALGLGKIPTDLETAVAELENLRANTKVPQSSPSSIASESGIVLATVEKELGKL
jgi:FlaA1/EpsC-like NDP-sugar epimerase